MKFHHRHSQQDDWVRGYTHFLLFFVIFSFVMTYSLILGFGWGSMVAVVFRQLWIALAIDVDGAPATPMLIAEASWICVIALITHSLFAITYDRESGFRIKYSIRTFVGRTICILLIMAGAFVTLRPFINYS